MQLDMEFFLARVIFLNNYPASCGYSCYLVAPSKGLRGLMMVYGEDEDENLYG